MKNLFFLLLASALILPGCGITDSIDRAVVGSLDIESALYEYPFDVVVVGEQWTNAVSDISGHVTGTLYIYESGSIQGEGVITYDALSDCEWEPPYPEGQEAPYCELMGTREGSVRVTGEVTSYAGTETEVDDAIHLTTLALGLHDPAPWTPGTLSLSFQIIEPSYEEIEFWGYADGERKPADTAAFSLILDAIGMFEDTVDVVPVMLGTDDSATLWELATYTFEGENSIASGVGTFYIK